MYNTPRIMIAATSSGCGKTTITCGILKLLLNKGLNVASFKCGPDYIDPMFHKKVLNINSRNLDLFLNSENTVKYLLAKNSGKSDIAVIEGVMGYYDGLGGTSLQSSSYHLSSVTETPTILVVNSKGKSLSILAEIKGFLEYKKDSNIKGVILNNMSKMLYQSIKPIIESELNIKVLGYVPKDDKFSLESRHLGLVTADEVLGIEEKLNYIADILSETIDLDSVINIAKSATSIEYENINIKKINPLKLAVARDKAFCFYYEDNLELLREIGVEIVEFSPLNDKFLPDNIHGLLLGGGYPELYLKELENNTSMKNDIKKKLLEGLPCLAECGGFMYLGHDIKTNREYKMVDFIKTSSFNTNRLSRFGYITLSPNNDLKLLNEETINAHEFHYFDSTFNGEAFNAKKPIGKRNWNAIVVQNNTFAGYPHIHYYSNLNFIYNFLDLVKDYKEGQEK